jgi:hypothetical protein
MIRNMKQKAKMSKPWIVAFLLLSGMAIFTACEKYSWVVETVDPEVPVLFQTEVQPIFTAKCIGCHKGTRNPDLRDGFSYASLTTGGYVALPAETSRLNKQLNSSSHTAFTLATEKQTIFIWIEQGAKNN